MLTNLRMKGPILPLVNRNSRMVAIGSTGQAGQSRKSKYTGSEYVVRTKMG